MLTRKRDGQRDAQDLLRSEDAADSNRKALPALYARPIRTSGSHVGTRESQRIGAIVCLAGNDEISGKSDAYYRALQDGTVPCPVIRFEIPVNEVPEDRDVFLSLARDVAHRLLAAENILVHCGAGVGRSGALAQCVLLVLGQTLNAAYAAVTDAGSWAETPQQRGLIRWCATEIANQS